jgi:hypothetical protein
VLTPLAGSALFLSSYTPLFVILFIENLGTRNLFALVFAGFAVLGLLSILLIAHVSRRDATSIPDRVVSYRERGDELMGYVSAYLIPFLAIDLSNWRQVVALAAFMLLLGYLYVTTSLIYVNPLLRILGYHVYEVVFERCGSQRFISKRTLAVNDCVEVVSLVRKVTIEGVNR